MFQSSAVLVAFSTRVEEDEIQGVLSYVIQCNQIDATDVAREFTLGLEPSYVTLLAYAENVWIG